MGSGRGVIGIVAKLDLEVNDMCMSVLEITKTLHESVCKTNSFGLDYLSKFISRVI